MVGDRQLPPGALEMCVINARIHPLCKGDYKWNAIKVTTLGALSMQVIVEVFPNPGEPSKAQYRVRPVEGQIFPTNMRVQCSQAMRQAFPLGSRFRLPVELVENKTGGRFLREVGKEPWTVLSGGV
jgi:hypothetical protein